MIPLPDVLLLGKNPYCGRLFYNSPQSSSSSLHPLLYLFVDVQTALLTEISWGETIQPVKIDCRNVFSLEILFEIFLTPIQLKTLNLITALVCD